jgi:hypothetical protein
VDHVSDQGKKADEAVTLLQEIWERPGTKVVIFSQWLRMHELLVRRFKARGWDHVLFHGGVPGAKRKDLVDRFREDPKCRAFLSTDAGGTGLNLQHATVVLNMDLPWNPAVLEQRVGRVHRLGQAQPVRVVNFVAQGTIEEGMLGVLKFKRSLFAGVLDGGEKDVFLGGSRLNKFMETVEKTTAAIPEAMLEDAEDALRTPPDEMPEPRTAPPSRRKGRPAPARPYQPLAPEPESDLLDVAASTALAADPWSGLLQAGMALLQQFAGGSRNGTADGPNRTALSARSFASLVQRDERTGETFVKLPVPPPEVLDQALRAVGALLEGLRR